MFAKAFLKSSGRKLAQYFMNEKEGERARLLEVRGFASEDLHEAFQSADVMALATQSSKHMMHLSVRNRAGEHLTDEQWLHVADRIEKRLSLSGQPRGIVFHTDEHTGDRHMHVGWSRIDDMTMTVRPVPFFILRLKEVCRELESELGLEVLSNRRKGNSRAAEHWEDQQARRLGVDVKALRAKICECWERSDDGKSFRAALAEQDMELVRGDRRSYLVMDEKGGLHALGKRLLGVPADDVRERLADLNYQALPTVAQAREQVRTGMRDQHAADLAWEDAVAAAAVAKEKAESRFKAEPRFTMDQYEHLASRILHEVTKYRATFTGYDLARALKSEVENDLDRHGLAQAILQHPEVARLSAKGGRWANYTTGAVLESERQVLSAAAALSSQDWHDVPLALVEAKQASFSDEKRRALAHMTGSAGLAILDGQAGTGKSSLLAAGKEVYEARGCRVVALAHQNQVVQSLHDKGLTGARTIDSELWALAHGRTHWTARTVIMIDEAAMVDTRRLGMLLSYANDAGAKVILAGDDRQLSSIERGGLFEVLKQRHGAAVLTEVHRQQVAEDRQASQLMATGNFAGALGIYETKNAIHWTGKPADSKADLVQRFLRDSAADPDKTRFIFAYTNREVDELNAAVRQVRIERGELSNSRSFETRHGRADFAVGDRLQFTATDKLREIYNGYGGTVRNIRGSRLTVEIDGRGKTLEFDSAYFQGFRHGYAGTIYKGQGRTIDQTYLLHSDHWRRTSSYVGLTRHSEKTDLFVAKEVAANLSELARQMSRVDQRRAASYFGGNAPPDHKPISAAEIRAWYANEDNRAREFANTRVTAARCDGRSYTSPIQSEIQVNAGARLVQASHGVQRRFGATANGLASGAAKTAGAARGALSGVARILGPLSALLGGGRRAPVSDAEERQRGYRGEMEIQERERKRRDDRQR
jgi:hypothetical protein